jgi:hypothetical protein
VGSDLSDAVAVLAMRNRLRSSFVERGRPDPFDIGDMTGRPSETPRTIHEVPEDALLER